MKQARGPCECVVLCDCTGHVLVKPPNLGHFHLPDSGYSEQEGVGSNHYGNWVGIRFGTRAADGFSDPLLPGLKPSSCSNQWAELVLPGWGIVFLC